MGIIQNIEQFVGNIPSKINIMTVAGWGLFTLLFAWFWRVYDLFGAIPAYGDALEVVWGIEWAVQQFNAGASPFFYDGVFYPAGWHTGTLAHPPLLFLIAQPFHWLGNSNFAYNMLAIIPLFITYIGAKRFFKLYTGEWSAIVAALVYTFVTMRTNRVHGHLHIYWATTFLPYLAYVITRWQRAPQSRHYAIKAGLWWGLMLNFSLYSLFLAPLTFLLLGRKLGQWRTWLNIILATLIALLLGSGALWLFYSASQTAGSSPPDFAELVNAGVPVNALIVPSVWHPIDIIKQTANSLFTGVIDEMTRTTDDVFKGVVGEGGYANWGAITTILALGGMVMLLRRRQGLGRILFAATGVILSMGLFLRWNGNVIDVGWMRGINQMIWEIGRFTKPDIFVRETIPSQLIDGVPLPGFLLTAALPFYESARIGSRFALVGGLGALALAAFALDNMPRWLAILFAGLWLIEMLPTPVTAHPLTAQPHPAHQYVADWADGASRVDVDRYLMHGGEALWGSWTSNIPTASIVGSFMPPHTDIVFDETYTPDAERFAAILRQFDVDYLFIHHRFPDVEMRWQSIVQSSSFVLHDCFDPVPDQPMQWEICVYEVERSTNDFINILPIAGWSPPEPWGIWTINQNSRAEFVAFDQTEHTINVEAFPNCDESRDKSQAQTMDVAVNNQTVGRYNWQVCETIQTQFKIPADVIQLGMNKITLSFAYAVRPDHDQRNLAVGFNRFEIVR